MTHFHDRPCAAPGLLSFRYRTQFSFVMIGARDRVDAISEAQRSSSLPVSLARLEAWDAQLCEYVPAFDAPSWQKKPGETLDESVAEPAY